MTQQEFYNGVHEELNGEVNLSVTATKEVINACFKRIAQALEKGDSVTIQGFGRFYVGDTKERNCRSFQTGEQITVPAKKVARFKPAASLKEAVNK